MLDIKQNKLLAFIVLLVLANIINLFIDKQSSIESKMLDAMESHQHESALAMASKLLEQEPGNQQAIKVVKESGQILLYLQNAQAKLPDFKVAKNKTTGELNFYSKSENASEDKVDSNSNEVIVKAEQVYEDFNHARAYVEKAKALDSNYKTTKNLEKKLDQAQAYVLNILAKNVYSVGESVYSDVSESIHKKSSIIKSAENSEYMGRFLSVQSAWAPIESSADHYEKKISPLLEKMDETVKLLADYNEGKKASLNASLLGYIEVIRNHVDVVEAPKGSFKDFIKIANKSMHNYSKAKKKLNHALSEVKGDNNFASLLKAITDYKLFQKKSTADLIQQNQYLTSA